MEYVILGLLLLKPMTAYEISGFIRKNLALICSGSAGSVQVALKKLMNSEAVTVEELLENSVNKKVYTITDAGKAEFLSWVQSPMQTAKVKNMELSKLFFLGFAASNERKTSIKNYIEQLRETQSVLMTIKSMFAQMSYEFKKIEPINADDILKFHEYTIDYGIDSAQFEINWYGDLLKKIGG